MEDAASPSELASGWVRKKIGKKGVMAIRKALRREARDFAEAHIQRSAARINKSKAFQRLSSTEQERVLQAVEWELQRRHFMRAEQGAVEIITATKKALRRKVSRDARAAGKKTIASAEKLLEAAKVKPIAGRLPVNHRYAGKAVPARKLPKKYRKKGLHFTEDGYPDFAPYAQELPSGKKQVQVKLSGDRDADIRAANKAVGLKRTPKGYTWHHHQDGTTMQLVPRDLHTNLRHTGGAAHYRHRTGDASTYRNVQD
jgi:hypothetical protein